MDLLLEDVAARAGLGLPDEAERALSAVLEALGESLSPADACALAEVLPPHWATIVRDGVHAGEPDEEALYSEVARREHVPRGFAVEHVISACRVIACRLPLGALERLQRALPRPFTIPDPAPPMEHHHTRGRLDTFAEGRPGSHHPLSEAAPSRVHRDSVSAENPHGDTKLSSASGLTQEREHESLSTGKPGSTRPIDEGSS